MTTIAFVPRPIYRIHTLGYVVEAGDTASGIAKKFGKLAGAYRELVAANLHGRTLMPMALGSPYSSRTFAELTAGEVLRIPATWPNPENGMLGAPGTVGEQMLDPIAAAMAQLASDINAASGPSNTYGAWLAAMTNAGVQWWHAMQGTTPAANPADYTPYLTSAIGWLNTYAIPQGLDPAKVANFPWGAFLAMLPASFDPSTVDWAGVIPGTQGNMNGIPWSSIPWAYLSQIGTQLETLKLPPVQWPSDTSPAAVLAAIQAAIQAAQGGGTPGTASCGQNSHLGQDNSCYCDQGYTWASATGWDCVAITGPAQPGQPGQPGPAKPGAQSCPANATYDASAFGGAGCYTCPAGQTYDLASHTCACPAGTMFDTNTGTCLAPPKSQADCAVDPGSVFDPNGSAGPHCYACDAGFTYSLTTKDCRPNTSTPNVQPACPQGFTRDKNGNCVQNAPPPPKKDDPKNVISGDDTNKTLTYAALGIGLLAIVGGGVYVATRPKTPEAKANASAAKSKGKKK